MARSSKSSKAFTELARLSRARKTLLERYSDPGDYSIQTDRGVAVEAATDLELALSDMIRSRMQPLRPEEEQALFQGERAPLGGFADKIWIAFGFGIFRHKARAEIDRIRRIRNAFAHAHKHLDFSTPEVIACCQELTYVERIPRPHFSHYQASKTWPPIDARHRYIETAKGLATALGILMVHEELEPRPEDLKDYPLD